ncbi:MAG: heavy metal transporter [Firmicutes bacterium]|nr:heavy metal transporter [Bacillota bacterium]
MPDGSIKKTFAVKGMSCTSCELKIEKSLRRITGVKEAKVSLRDSRATVIYDPQKTDSAFLVAAIQQLGYEVYEIEDALNGSTEKMSFNQLFGIGIAIFAIYLIIKSTLNFNFVPQVDQTIGYGMLFLVGLLTSLHCIAMCGGINLTQSLNHPSEGARSKLAQFKPGLLYNLGRIISYTLLGGVAGSVGSVISFSGAARGAVAIIGGAFMMLIGLKMLDIFPWLRRLRFGLPRFFGNQIYENKGRKGQLVIGLVNGLMPCGPLQTMQLYALGTGSFAGGAISMFFFSLGTVPLMFGFGASGSMLIRKFRHVMLKASAILGIVLGLIMANRGLHLSGITTVAAPVGGGNVAVIQGDVQVVTTTVEPSRYQPFIVQKGIPVHWIVKARAEDLNGCNNRIIIPRYNIEKRLVPGENVIEFTPVAGGTITYTCWMGMISSVIKVVPDLSRISEKNLDKLNSESKQEYSGGGCCSAGTRAGRFAGGRIPTDDIEIARVKNGIQMVAIEVNEKGFSPAAIVLQKGVKVKIRFIAERLTYCNFIIQFPEYRGQLDLRKGQLETPELEATRDFTFRCWMGMLNGYFKVVNDINNVNLERIKEEIRAYRPVGDGGCCGG